MNGEQSLMHAMQAFLVDTIKQVRVALPEDVTIVTHGRTILRGESGGRAFGVRVRMGFVEDDMWPHVEAIFEVDGQESTEAIHPDTTPSGHAAAIVEQLQSRLSS